MKKETRVHLDDPSRNGRQDPDVSTGALQGVGKGPSREINRTLGFGFS
jgi:hypothetical protein